jgi:hypothetical protein
VNIFRPMLRLLTGGLALFVLGCARQGAPVEDAPWPFSVQNNPRSSGSDAAGIAAVDRSVVIDPTEATPAPGSGLDADAVAPGQPTALSPGLFPDNGWDAAGSGRYTVAAMLGQVNGQPIYAGTVLEPITEQLETLGRTLPRAEFQRRASQLISGRLVQIVADALILGEAEQRLTDREREGLRQGLQKEREELIRFWGRGSEAVADDALQAQTSRNLEQTLEDTRQKVVVQQYLRQKLFPKINVTRKDVGRYYRDHADEFNPPSQRVLRLICVKESPAAEQVQSMLDRGEPFEQTAQESVNRYHPERGGLVSETSVGDQVFGQRELNQAMLSLRAGEHSPCIRIGEASWWVFVESLEQSPGRALKEVQLEIEDLLRRERFRDLTQKYREQMFENGSYDPIEAMADTLSEVVMARYAVTP